MSLFRRELTEAEKLQAIAALKSLNPNSYVLQLYLAKPLPTVSKFRSTLNGRRK